MADSTSGGINRPITVTWNAAEAMEGIKALQNELGTLGTSFGETSKAGTESLNALVTGPLAGIQASLRSIIGLSAEAGTALSRVGSGTPIAPAESPILVAQQAAQIDAERMALSRNAQDVLSRPSGALWTAPWAQGAYTPPYGMNAPMPPAGPFFPPPQPRQGYREAFNELAANDPAAFAQEITQATDLMPLESRILLRIAGVTPEGFAQLQATAPEVAAQINDFYNKVLSKGIPFNTAMDMYSGKGGSQLLTAAEFNAGVRNGLIAPLVPPTPQAEIPPQPPVIPQGMELYNLGARRLQAYTPEDQYNRLLQAPDMMRGMESQLDSYRNVNDVVKDYQRGILSAEEATTTFNQTLQESEAKANRAGSGFHNMWRESFILFGLSMAVRSFGQELEVATGEKLPPFFASMTHTFQLMSDFGMMGAMMGMGVGGIVAGAGIGLGLGTLTALGSQPQDIQQLNNSLDTLTKKADVVDTLARIMNMTQAEAAAALEAAKNNESLATALDHVAKDREPPTMLQNILDALGQSAQWEALAGVIGERTGNTPADQARRRAQDQALLDQQLQNTALMAPYDKLLTQVQGFGATPASGLSQLVGISDSAAKSWLQMGQADLEFGTQMQNELPRIAAYVASIEAMKEQGLDTSQAERILANEIANLGNQADAASKRVQALQLPGLSFQNISSDELSKYIGEANAKADEFTAKLEASGKDTSELKSHWNDVAGYIQTADGRMVAITNKTQSMLGVVEQIGNSMNHWNASQIQMLRETPQQFEADKAASAALFNMELQATAAALRAQGVSEDEINRILQERIQLVSKEIELRYLLNGQIGIAVGAEAVYLGLSSQIYDWNKKASDITPVKPPDVSRGEFNIPTNFGYTAPTGWEVGQRGNIAGPWGENTHSGRGGGAGEMQFAAPDLTNALANNTAALLTATAAFLGIPQSTINNLPYGASQALRSHSIDLNMAMERHGMGDVQAFSQFGYFPQVDKSGGLLPADISALSAQYAAQYGPKAGVDSGVLNSIIQSLILAESGGNVKAVGDNGNSIGLFQMNMAGGAGSGYTAAQLQDPNVQMRAMVPQIADAVKQGLSMGLTGSDLAVYVGKTVERPAAGNEQAYGTAYDKLQAAGAQFQASATTIQAATAKMESFAWLPKKDLSGYDDGYLGGGGGGHPGLLALAGGLSGTPISVNGMDQANLHLTGIATGTAALSTQLPMLASMQIGAIYTGNSLLGAMLGYLNAILAKVNQPPVINFVGGAGGSAGNPYSLGNTGLGSGSSGMGMPGMRSL